MSMNTVNDRMVEAEADDTYDGYIIGEVLENDDPEGLSRIKVKVPELYDPSLGPIPWVGAHKQSPFGIGPNYGVYGSPAIGSKVRIKLQGNDPHYALAEADEYNKEAANPKFKNPKTWGFKDPGGSELFVNYETEQWEFTHSSGLTLKYNTDGKLELHVPGDRAEDSKTWTVTVNEEVTITAGTSMELNASDSAINASSSLAIDSPTVDVASDAVTFDAALTKTTGVLQAGNGASGTFTSKENKIITVENGIITKIIG